MKHSFFIFLLKLRQNLEEYAKGAAYAIHR